MIYLINLKKIQPFMAIQGFYLPASVTHNYYTN